MSSLSWIGLRSELDASAALLALALGTGHLAPLAVRRTRPTTAFTLVSLSCLAQLVLLDMPVPSDIGFLIATHALASYGPFPLARRAGLLVAAAAGLLGAWDWSAPTATMQGDLPTGMTLSILAVVSWLWGDVARRRREVLERLHEQNQALRRDRDQRARIAAQDERTRIAREMHDIVAHSLSVVVVQADGAAYVAQHAPQWDRDQALATLHTIAATARQALAETRHLVGVLRAPVPATTGAAQGLAAEYAPTGSLGALPELLDRIRAAGVQARLRLAPELTEPSRVSEQTSLAAYRIVQESLTNVIKHAGPGAQVEVAVDASVSWLHLAIRDTGLGAAAPTDGFGHGLIGMRERAESVGGQLVAGPRPEGGFSVTASLPRHPAPAHAAQSTDEENETG
ncbi:MAG: sensor histidine kinase [Austwickia sp.]|jgi:signal transduction histidine kinase|nr:sensor histidine kinase [Austwickia sp.]